MIENNDLQKAIDENIRSACWPQGDDASLRERERATAVLVSYGKPAYEHIKGLLNSKPECWEASRLIEILGAFNVPEAVALLKTFLLQGKPDTSRAAARSLANLKTIASEQAFNEALLSEDTEVRIAVVEGIRLTGNTQWCSKLDSVLNDKDANLRYYALNTAAMLGCIDENYLTDVNLNDDDRYVRELALKFLENKSHQP